MIARPFKKLQYFGGWISKLSILCIFMLPKIVQAQYFYSSDWGDVDAGFRKTGSHQEEYEMVVYLGNITNFLQVPAGTKINITNYNASQLSAMCPDGFGNLQWSVFSSFESAFSPDGIGMPTSFGEFPNTTCWYTIPRTNATIQTKPVSRLTVGLLGDLSARMYSLADGANTISQQLGVTNADNNTLVVLEPVSLAQTGVELTTFIGDRQNPAFGDFYGTSFAYSVENTTSNNFASAAVSDFYQNCPTSTANTGTFVDPITGLTNGVAYNVGYFTLNPNGSMTFTRASAVTAPSAGAVFSAVTNGFSPLTVVFTNSASGNITNWVWNFGNGTIITNSTGNDVTNTYTAGGDYTVTLTVNGPGGSATVTVANYIVALPSPTVTATLSGSNIVLSGTNCPAGVQYRILATSSLTQTLATWSPVVTNTFLGNGTFTYTNPATNSQTYFRLVSP